MKIITDKPPNFDEIDKKFNIAGKPVIFAWGDKIYNPENTPISPELMVHEMTHGKSQGSTPEQWWKLYLLIPAFRLEEEFMAHHSEYVAFMMNNKDKNAHARYLHSVALRLSSSLYANLISYPSSMRSLKHGKLIF
jgi:hypothetical protein